MDGLVTNKKLIYPAFFLAGVLVCLISFFITPLLIIIYRADQVFVDTNVSPIIEEFLKGVPVLLFALFVSDKRDTLIWLSLTVGLGFSVLENFFMIYADTAPVTLLWAVTRGVGTAVINCTCTMLLGMGISYVRKRKKLFGCGTSALLMASSTLHAIFNLIAFSEYRYFCILWALMLSVPLALMIVRLHRKRK